MRPESERRVRPRPFMEVSALTDIRMRRRQEGQTMAEYAVVLGVITPFLVLAFATMGDAIVARVETVIGFLT
jgi:Flp pilus assembly pilin Flp